MRNKWYLVGRTVRSRENGCFVAPIRSRGKGQDMSILAKRLDAHFVACAAAAGAAVVGATQQSQAAVVYSGVVNLPIPNSTNGLYLNVVTGANNLPPPGSAGSTVPGWDINPFSSTSLSFFNPSPLPGGGSAYFALTGTTVARMAGGVGAPSIGGVGSLWGTTNTAWNPAPNSGYFGFRFIRESDSTLHYGWAQINNPSLATRVLVDYAYDDGVAVEIAAGQVPAPGSIALLAVGAAGLIGRRRK